MSPMTLRRPSAAWSALALALLSFLALPPAADAAFPGANGKIAFFSDRDGGFGIYTMNPDGSGQTRLGNDPSVWGTDSAWSPDGTKVAFGNLGISTINADGTGLTSIGGGPSASGPAWSPDGTKIAFVNQIEIHAYLPEIWTMNADGTNQTAVSTPPFNDQYPAWSPDGTKIALMGFGDGQNDIYTMNPDGSDRAKVTNDAASEGPPNWSPDGSRIAFDRSEGSSNSGEEIYVVKPDGTSLVNLTNNAEARDMVPAWSPDGTKIAFMSDRDGNWEIYVMNANGTGVVRLTNSAAYDASGDWQPIPYTGYPRPKGATPFRASLVVAFKNCTAPNEQHGPALVFPSCAPPVQESDWLTTGTADSNGQATEFVGSMRFATVVGNPATPTDEADVAATMNITDVRTKAAMTDYGGELQANAVLRITDRNNSGPPGGGTDAATVVDIPFPVNASCAPTADPLIGATCAVSTSMDAIVPGAVKEGKRAVWQIGQVQVYDGGADGSVATTPNTLFARQGVFVP